MHSRQKILLIDDEKGIVEAFSFMLVELGYDVKTALNAEDGDSFISEEAFDIIFLDQFLGPAKGIDLMKKILRRNPDLYFVIMTANGSVDLAVEALKEGAADFVTKPFFLADIIKSIEYVNKKRELERQQKDLFATMETKIEEKTKGLNAVYFSVLSSLAQAMEKRDLGTFGHSRRVSQYSRLIGAALNLPEEKRESLKVAAMLHDIGKIGITDFILGKPGAINVDEMDIVKSHPQKGVEILSPLINSLPQFASILPAVLYHHENMDGSGYPEGISGDRIPLLARIIAVADTYDAILSNRPYRSGSSHSVAIKELRRCAGQQFDKDIVQAFVETYEKYQKLFPDDPVITEPDQYSMLPM